MSTAEERPKQCPHGIWEPNICEECIPNAWPSAETLRKVREEMRFRTIAKVGPAEMREITRGAEWEFKIEGVAPILPRQRLTLRLSEGEAATLWNYAYMPSTGRLVKYKLRRVILEYFGQFMLDLIDATGMPILILPWGDPIGSWSKEKSA